jgi:autotransporter-associated beta strand protein
MSVPARLNRPFAILCLLSLMAQQVQAQSVFSVSDILDSGLGSLRQAVSDSNAAGGANTISWTSSAGGGGLLGGNATILLQSPLPGIAAGTTLDATAAPSNVTISSGLVPLAGAVTFTNNSLPQVWRISSNISDAASAGTLVKAGAGELDLSGANTYSGGTALDAGTLGVENSFSLGSGTLTFNGGNLSVGPGVNAANAIQLAADATFSAVGANATLSGVISDGGPGYSLTKVGPGTLYLANVHNSYSGGTTVAGGEIGIDNFAELGTGPVTLNGGGLLTLADFAASPAITLGAAGGTIDTGVSFSTFTGAFSGAGSLTTAGAGTLYLTGANTYQGGTNLNSGTLKIGTESSLGSGGLSFNGGTLQTAGGLTDSRSATLNSGGGTIDSFGQTSTFSGVFADGNAPGGLTITDTSGGGTGKVILANANNTYSGGTTIDAGTLSISTDSNLGNAAGLITFNGGTLQTSAGLTTGRNIALAGNGTIDTLVYNSTFTGVIYGGGALIQEGSGTLFLTNANSYSGGTVFNSGTINISSASGLGSGDLIFNGIGTLQTAIGTAIASTITINAGATAQFDMMGNTSTISGVIGGTGNLALISSGTLTLTGANTYLGTTLVSNLGVLNINSASAISTNTLILNNGTLQTAAPLALANNVTLGAGGGTIDAYGQVSSFSGAFSGAGALNIADTLGGGTIVLTGTNNNYTGGTFVYGGTLQLGAKNAISPVGAGLTINPGGTFDMQNFTQNVTAFGFNGLAGGTLKMILLQHSVINLTVGGTADVTNGTLAVGLTPQVAQSLVDGITKFTPITAGLVTGEFNSNLITPAAISFTPSYAVNGTSVVLTTKFIPFANSAINPNQATIGNMLQPLRSTGPGGAAPLGDLGVVISNLYTLDAPHLQAAFDQIGPVSLAAMSSLGLAGSALQTAAVGQRIAALADGTAPDGVTNYTVSGHTNYPGGPLLAYAGDDLGSLDLYSARKRPVSNSPWGFYASGVGSTGRLGEANTSAGTQPGYAFNTGGLAGGGDYRLNKNLAVGASLSYLHGHASIYAPGSGTIDNNSARYGLYAAGYNETARASLYIGGAADFFSTNRGIEFAEISRVATASPKGNELNVDASGSFDVKSRTWGTFSPFAGLDYTRLMIGSFAESQAQSLDLDVAAQTALSLQSSLGLRYSQKIETDSCLLTPYISAGWRHEFEDQSRPITAQLPGISSNFTVATGSYARDGTLLGTGFILDWGKGFTAKADYSGDFRSHFQDNSYNATLRYKF